MWRCLQKFNRNTVFHCPTTHCARSVCRKKLQIFVKVCWVMGEGGDGTVARVGAEGRRRQAGEETTCDLTLLQPDQSSVLLDHQVMSLYRNCNALKTIFKRNIRFLVVFKTKKIVPHHQRRWSKLTTVKKLSSETTLARLNLCDPNPKSELRCLDWRRRRKCWDRSSEDEKQTNLYIGKPSQSHPFS